jgi:hypothetical protein
MKDAQMDTLISLLRTTAVERAVERGDFAEIGLPALHHLYTLQAVTEDAMDELRRRRERAEGEGEEKTKKPEDRLPILRLVGQISSTSLKVLQEAERGRAGTGGGVSEEEMERIAVEVTAAILAGFSDFR